MNSNYYSIVREEIIPLLPLDFDTVMEIGCGAGSTLKKIKEDYQDVRTIGIEINESVAKTAQNNVDVVYNMDVEHAKNLLNEYQNSIDVLLLLDIIEHLREPWLFLNNCRELLSEEGVIIASIPNVRNFKVLLPLVFQGRWDYQNSGILDITHLRFFTKKSIFDVADKCNLNIIEMRRSGPFVFSRINSSAGYLAYFLNLISFGLVKEFICHQYIVKMVGKS